MQQTITLVAIIDSWDHRGLPLVHLLAILCCMKVTEGQRGVEVKSRIRNRTYDWSRSGVEGGSESI